ncbi:C40 family peptidase [Curtobacterium sp. MCPF17_031]|uniref:C40 family peptidase n=1 Tax=Curtobacterium sp. MCPF17_031 TaxID=2175653 RepID=UPI000DA9339B|nr:C40 family peptidase [Curtobacterium sp. MCPF17_031]PZE37860.1 peptidoglycan endopeptidase [Curtobacterium sp. MCPF17_031]
MTHTGTAADDSTTANPTNTGDATPAPLTRRAAREAAERATRRPLTRTASTPARTQATPVRAGSALGVARTATTTAPKPTAASRKRRFMAPVVLAVAAGMFGTMAVPAAFASTQPSTTAETARQSLVAAQSQEFDVSAAAGAADTSRDGFGATSTATLTAEKAAEHAKEVEAARAAAAAQYAYDGKTAEDYLATAKTGTANAAPTATSAAATAATPVAAGTPFSLPAVVATAKQYIGTPYVFGGATPAGFDCSGYVMYVYAQYGINLAHSVPLQDQAGTTIPESEAQPGDVVIFNNEAHDGFYMGNGMIMDAPKPGGAVSIRPIWTSDYHIVRFGI